MFIFVSLNEMKPEEIHFETEKEEKGLTWTCLDCEWEQRRIEEGLALDGGDDGNAAIVGTVVVGVDVIRVAEENEGGGLHWIAFLEGLLVDQSGAPIETDEAERGEERATSKGVSRIAAEAARKSKQRTDAQRQQRAWKNC